MVKTDNQGNWHLRPKARIMKAIGEDLISSEVVAITELVKNAYDADATIVLIRFTAPLEKDLGAIDIIDNGHGMSLTTLQTVWLEPATSFKKTKRYSKTLNRRLLGEKGIGRFGAARLANELLVTSRETGANTEATVLFDWSQFDDDEKYLDEVVIPAQEGKPHYIVPHGEIENVWQYSETTPSVGGKTHGTILRMSSLKSHWNMGSIKKLRESLSRLISPIAPLDFNIYLELPEDLSDISGPIHPPTAYEHPHYKVTGEIDKFGHYKLQVVARGELYEIANQAIGIPTNTDQRNSLTEKPQQTECGAFQLDFRIWDLDMGSLKELVSNHEEIGAVRDIQRDIKSIAGISVYRDGLGVATLHFEKG